MTRLRMIAALLLLPLGVGGCVTTTTTTSKDGRIKVTTIGVVGCGSPSQRITLVETKGKPDMTLGSAGADPCNTALSAALGAAGQIGGALALPSGAGITNSVVSGSQATSTQGTNVNVNQ